jgi:hypothetical protein
MIDWMAEQWRLQMTLEHAAAYLPPGDDDRDLLESVVRALGRSASLSDARSSEPTELQDGQVPRQ